MLGRWGECNFFPIIIIFSFTQGNTVLKIIQTNLITPLRQGLWFSVRIVSRSNRMLFHAILKVSLVEILLICTIVHRYQSVWDYPPPNSCPRQRTETVNLLRGQLKQEMTHFHCFSELLSDLKICWHIRNAIPSIWAFQGRLNYGFCL